MKLVTYSSGSEISPRVGVVRDREVFDLSSVAPNMIALLAGGEGNLARAGKIMGTARPAATLDQVALLAPIPWPPKILALAGNYQKHLVECGGQEKDKAKFTPQVFMMPGTTVLAPGGTILRSRMTDRLDHEVELGVVIGARAKHVGVDEASACIAGYTITNDISSRRIINLPPQREVDERGRFFDWLMGKWQDTALPMGPWIVTRDELGAADDLELRLTVNGELRQQARTSEMIYSAAEVVSFLSKFLTLQPGDVICTGTPHGVGMGSGKYLQPGDKIVAWIEGIGELCNDVGQEL